MGRASQDRLCLSSGETDGGYLFYGDPCCGKTSFALALAGHFELLVYLVPLMEVEIDDSKLSNVFRRIIVASVLVLEGVDCAGIGRTRNDETSFWQPEI